MTLEQKRLLRKACGRHLIRWLLWRLLLWRRLVILRGGERGMLAFVQRRGYYDVRVLAVTGGLQEIIRAWVQFVDRDWDRLGYPEIRAVRVTNTGLLRYLRRYARKIPQGCGVSFRESELGNFVWRKCDA